jgi:hypothetical protein
MMIDNILIKQSAREVSAKVMQFYPTQAIGGERNNI